jgi:hypothetical protein
MGWASVGRAGSTGNSALNSSSITCTLNGQEGSGANVADFLVCNIGVMRGTTVGNTDAGAVLGVADSKSNTWVKVRERQSSGATVAAGVVGSLWCCDVSAALTTTDTVTATFGSTATRDQQAAIVWRFSKSGAVVTNNSTHNVGLASSVLGTLDLTQNGTEFLRLRACSVRVVTTTAHSFSTTAGWTSIGTTESASSIAVLACGEFLITTASTVASAPTIVGSTVSGFVTIYANFEENTLMGDSIF